MDLDRIVKDELIKYINQHVRIEFINKNGDRHTWYGYIREVNEDHVIFEDNELPDRFKIRNIKVIEPCKGGKDEKTKEAGAGATKADQGGEEKAFSGEGTA